MAASKCAACSSSIDTFINPLFMIQNENMLDKTKCSITSRKIFNNLASDYTVACNDNLSHLKPNLDCFKADFIGNRVFYIHYDHLTNETSHYFIIILIENEVMVLQSAVFEFNIHEWLFPLPNLESITQEYGNLSKDCDDLRDKYVLEQKTREYHKQKKILENIDACPYSSKRIIDKDEFLNSFIIKLEQLEGDWTLGNLEEKIELYAHLFSCQLNKEIIKSHIKLGCKPACVKYIYKDVRSLLGGRRSPLVSQSHSHDLGSVLEG